jgi:hypothetical protein
MAADIKILQDIAVLGVTVEDTNVIVDIYGGPDNICGTARLTIPDAQRQDALEQLEGWRRSRTPVTLIVNGPEVRFHDERATFADIT